MRFLYCGPPVPLEPICERWHLICRKWHFDACLRGFPNLIRINAFRVQAKPRCMRRTGRRKEHQMLDIVMLAIGLGFFALSVGYAVACDQL